MTIYPTQVPPTLDLDLIGGDRTDSLKLGSGQDGRFTMAVFYRGLHCPVCRKQLTELDRRIGDLNDAGVGRVIAVSMETEERSARVVQKWGLTDLPVAYGLSEQSAREWGLFISTAIKEGEPATFNEPGMFVLDSDGSMFWSSVASMPFGRPALGDVIAGLRYVQNEDYPARGVSFSQG